MDHVSMSRARRWSEMARNAVFVWTVVTVLLRVQRQLRVYGLRGVLTQQYARLRRIAFLAFLAVPTVQTKVQAKIDDALDGLACKMLPGPDVARYKELPVTGWCRERCHRELDRLDAMGSADWRGGKVSGAIYHGGEQLSELLAHATGLFSLANPLHPDLFPGVRKMEAEIVAMCLCLFHAPPATAAGTTTSGGTESILLACRAAAQMAKQKHGISSPEIVVPVTAHAAFDKAGAYFGITIRHAPIDPLTMQVDVAAVAGLINARTVLIVASAPNFPHGVIDNIPALSALALSRKLPLHVDACLGSFLLPFLERAGFDAPAFDFRIPGVTSISCDTHKYGFAPKVLLLAISNRTSSLIKQGSSVVMYRDREMRQCAYFIATEWPGGIYASPTLAGSRPGSLVAGCWTAMVNTGQDGYLESCKSIVGARIRIEARIRAEIPELQVLGKPSVSVVAFTSEVLDIYRIGDHMSSLGWHLNGLQSVIIPPV